MSLEKEDLDNTVLLRIVIKNKLCKTSYGFRIMIYVDTRIFAIIKKIWEILRLWNNIDDLILSENGK